MNNRNIIKTSHKLNHFRGAYTPLELDFIYSFISTIKKEDTELKEYTLTLEDLEKKLKKRLRLTEIEYIFDSLASKTFKINNEKNLTVYTFFTKFDYDKVNKRISVKFNPELKPHLIQLKTYAMGNLRYILSMKGEYSKRLYMLLSQWYVAKKAKYSVIDLREMLALPESYAYADLKRVLKRAQKEMKQHAPFYFEFKEKKEGRRVVDIEFHLHKNDADLEAFKEEIFEEFADMRLIEINGQLLYANREQGLYFYDKDGERQRLNDAYEKKCWREIFKKKEKLAIYQPSLLNYAV